jgi:hypothetical protein
MESKINISLLKDFLLSLLCFDLRIRTSITKPMVNIPNDTVFFIRHLNYYCSIHYKTSAKFLRGNLDENWVYFSMGGEKSGEYWPDDDYSTS